ncbi:MAG: DUF86 domain-containing protein [Lentisphaeria bacterium]|nr:DUF86 domain-containing protein [Lentisphaeria bacterium]
MTTKGNHVFLLHIVDSFQCILEYVSDITEDEFYKNRMVQDAVIRNYEIIGEAAKNLSEDFTARHNEINWHGMAGFRDVLAHRYFGVDLEQVWEIIEKNAANDLSQIQSLPEYIEAKKMFEEQ